MVFFLELVTVVLLLFMLACCHVSADCAEQERNAGLEDPCATCLRWEECDDCPLRKEVK
jgi:hypothetical protein